MRVLVGRESPQDGSYSWAREGYNISYKQNGYKRTARDTNHYTLTFEVDCVQDEGMYIAYCYPYTYTDLCADL